ncbi:hypothetical protein SUDANB176_05976 [Streptomyces sp. enrichment culture]|uniref:hypothetical protein n=1 Tax=Streptomyces sp. enrichment culture TaxID=1795815 RepID=UPI003F56BC71
MHRDPSVLYVDLPLTTAGGALVPLTAWLLTLRTLRRPWLAAVTAAGALALGIRGLLGRWTPYRRPEVVYRAGKGTDGPPVPPDQSFRA